MARGAAGNGSGLRYEVRGAAPAEPLVDALVEVYRDVYAHERRPFFGEARYRAQLAGHREAPGWQVALAWSGPQLAGYAYGFPLPPTTRWWQGLTTPVPDGFAAEDGGRTFAVSEVMVRARWRRRGVARTLVELLLAGRGEQRGTLLVEPGNEPAQAAYRAWGWTKAAELRPSWPAAPVYDVLVLPLAGAAPVPPEVMT